MGKEVIPLRALGMPRSFTIYNSSLVEKSCNGDTRSRGRGRVRGVGTKRHRSSPDDRGRPHQQKAISKVEKIDIATWNIHCGLGRRSSRWKDLEEDFKAYGADVYCLQETSFSEESQIIHMAGGDLLMAGTRFTGQLYYGLGFFVSPKLAHCLESFEEVSHRIAILTLRASPRSTIAFINAYAPTAGYKDTDPEEYDRFYQDLGRVYSKLASHHTLVIIAGDFNAKIGLKKSAEETFMGSYGKGTRNYNGNLLANFLHENDLYLANTTFKKAMRHRSTWSGVTKEDKPLYNMIDYIIIPQRYKGMLEDSQSYHGHRASSDHGIVKAKINLKYLMILLTKKNKDQKAKRKSYNTWILAQNEDIRNQFQGKVDEVIQPHQESTLEEIRDALIAAGEEIVGHTPPSIGAVNSKKKYPFDPQIEKLSKEQQKLRLQIYHSNPPLSKQRKDILRADRRRCFKEMRYMMNKNYQSYISHIIAEIEEVKNDQAACFRSLKTMRLISKPYQKLKLCDEQGNMIVNKNRMLEIVEEYYKDLFTKISFSSDTRACRPEEFSNPITANEIEEIIKLRNGRAMGIDEIPGEFIKYGSWNLSEKLAQQFNQLIVSNKHNSVIHEAILVP